MQDQLAIWKRQLLEKLETWVVEDEIAVSSPCLVPEEGYGDIDYESILKDEYRTVSREHPFCVKAIEGALQRIRNVPAPLVAELGCGDGRFIRLFLESGLEQIVGLDISRTNLRRLEKRIRETPGASEKVLLIEGDAFAPSFLKDVFDLVIVIGVLQVLDNERYPQGLAACANTLRPGGYLLTIDPTDFGAVMYAIVRHDLEELHQVLELNTKSVDIENRTGPRTAVRSVKRIKEAHAAAGLEVEEMMGIPLFPSLLFGGVKPVQNLDQEALALIKNLNDQLIAQFPECWRSACVLSRKPH